MLAAICCNDYIIRKAHKDDANRIYYLVQGLSPLMVIRAVVQ